MRNLSKIALSILSTLVASSVFAQCPVGGPCPYQQGGYDSGYYSGGYGGGGYGGGYSGNYSYSSPNYDSSPGYGYSSGTRQRTARGHFRNVPPQTYSNDFDGQMQGGYYQHDSMMMGSPSMGMQGGYYQQDSMGSPSYQGGYYQQDQMPYGQSGSMYDQQGSRGMYSQPGSSNAGYSSQGTTQSGSSTNSSTGASNPSTGTQQR